MGTVTSTGCMKEHLRPFLQLPNEMVVRNTTFLEVLTNFGLEIGTLHFEHLEGLSVALRSLLNDNLGWLFAVYDFSIFFF